MLKYLFLSILLFISFAVPEARASDATEQNQEKEDGEKKKSKSKKKKKKQSQEVASGSGKNLLLERAVRIKWLTGNGSRTWESTSITLNGSPLSGRISYTFDAQGNFREVNQDMPMRARWQLMEDMKSINLSERYTSGGPEIMDFIFEIVELTNQKLVVRYAKPTGKDAGGEMVITFRAVE